VRKLFGNYRVAGSGYTLVADGDIVVISQKVVSKAEGRIVPEADRAGVVSWVARPDQAAGSPRERAVLARVLARRGEDVNASDNCPNVGASLRDDWINGNWTGGPNVVNYPDPTYVCRVSGLSSSDWSSLEQRIGDDLIFPVNDCTTQVDSSGNTVTCFPSQPPDKYNIIGFMVLHLDEVLDQKSEWEGDSGTCDFGPVNMTPTIGDFDLAYAYETLARAHRIAEQLPEAEAYERLAVEAGARITDPDDREHFLEDLATLR
jgi:hypothetical protein